MPLIHKEYTKEDVKGMCSVIAETRNAALSHGDFENAVMLSHLHKLLYDAYIGENDGSVTMVIDAETAEGTHLPAIEVTPGDPVKTLVEGGGYEDN